MTARAAIVVALAALAACASCKRQVGGAVVCKNADEAVSQEAKLRGKRMLVVGKVRPGSAMRREAPCELRFEVERAGARLEVRSAQCGSPEGLRDGVDVGVLGTLEPGLVLSAESIRVRVPPLPYPEKLKDWSCEGPLD